MQVTSLLLEPSNSFSSVSGLHINILSIYRICSKRPTVQVQVGEKYTRRDAGDILLNAVKRGLCDYLGKYSTGTCFPRASDGIFSPFLTHSHPECVW